MPLLDGYVANPDIQPVGPIANTLPKGGTLPDSNWVRMRQPFLDDYGRACVMIHDINGEVTKNDSTGGEPRPLLRTYLCNDLRNLGYNLPAVTNATSLHWRDWIQVDSRAVRAYRQRLRAWQDLVSANSYGGFNAMGKMTLEYQAMSDPGEAVVDMDATTDGRNDIPLQLIRSIPLPITHSDFGFSQRELLVSRNGATPYDLVMSEAAARRVGETVEDTVIGNVTGVTYGTISAGPGLHTGTSTVYGYRTFPQRLLKTNFTAPTAGGWTPETTYNEILAALDQLYAQFSYGPFIIYHSIDWSQYINRQFSVAGGNAQGETLRSMLLKIEGVQDVRRLDRLTATFTLIIVSMTAEVAEAINGMDVTTVQWEEKGGLELRFKVMVIQVPRLRMDYSNRTGVLHGTTA